MGKYVLEAHAWRSMAWLMSPGIRMLGWDQF